MTSLYNFTGCAGSSKYQSWWFRIMGFGLMLKGPRAEPLFSERYGYMRAVIRARGWRLFVLKRRN